MIHKPRSIPYLADGLRGLFRPARARMRRWQVERSESHVAGPEGQESSRYVGRRLAKAVGWLVLCWLILARITPLGWGQCGPQLTPSAASGRRAGIPAQWTAAWQYPSEELTRFPATAYRDLLLVPLTGGRMVALYSATGQAAWQTELGGEWTAPALADETGIYTLRVQQGSATSPPITQLQRLSPQTGIPQGGVFTLYQPVKYMLQTPTRLVLATADGRVVGVSKAKLVSDWEERWAGNIETLGQAGGTLYALTSTPKALPTPADSSLLLFSAAGDSYRLTGLPAAPAKPGPVTLVTSSYAIVSYETGELSGIDLASRPKQKPVRWRQRVGGAVTSLQNTSAGVLVTSLDNYAYLLEPLTGKRLWKTQLAGRVLAPPLVVGEVALVTPLAGSAAVALDLRTGRPQASLFVGEDNLTATPPVCGGGRVLLTTREALIAFGISPK